MTETAWLAERLDGTDGPEYATVSDIGMVEFTKDPNKALRFSRMEDARTMAGLFEFEDVRAREHMWPELAAPRTVEEPAELWMIERAFCFTEDWQRLSGPFYIREDADEWMASYSTDGLRKYRISRYVRVSEPAAAVRAAEREK